MADLALNPVTGDLLIENGALSIHREDDGLVQRLAIRLRFFLGEWFLDTRLGIPYYEEILLKNPDLVLVRGFLRQAVASTPGVLTVKSFDLALDASLRRLSVDFTVTREPDGDVLDFNREFIIA